MRVTYPLRVYYDRSCPLCRSEMHALKQYDDRQRLELVDCSPPDFSDEIAREAGHERSAMMRLIHARDADGKWLVGVPVFEAAYAATGILGIEKMWANPILKPFWNAIYPWVADHRMGLSRLGLNRIFGWMVRRAAKKASLKSQACAKGLCEID